MSPFIFAANLSDLSEGQLFATRVDDVPVALTMIAGRVHAVGDVCTHDDGPLAEGELDGLCVVCPRHGARFDLLSGKGTFPAAGPIPIYETRIEGDAVLIRL